MVRRVLRLVTSEAKRREIVSSTRRSGKTLPAVHCDPIQIEQVVLNLILNAFDAMSDEESDDTPHRATHRGCLHVRSSNSPSSIAAKASPPATNTKYSTPFTLPGKMALDWGWRSAAL